MPLSAAAWAYPALALVGSGLFIAWRSRSRALASGFARASASARRAAKASPLPADGFDRHRVLAEVKPHFVRLQAAWDLADLATLRELTTPAMYDEIAVQLALRGPAPNRTDVLTLHAELLGIEQVGPLWLASVQYSGMLRETCEHGAVPFRELWMLTLPTDGTAQGWRLARQQALW
jgi:predicted lipid-binding transport protein (Tim44 family)